MKKKYMPYFFPVAGVAIGAVMCIFRILCMRFHFDVSGFALIGAAFPVLLSAGVPLNGFLRTVEKLTDSLFRKMRGSREEKRTDFYAVIAAGAYYLLYAGGLVFMEKEEQFLLLGISYMISRVLSVMAFLWFPDGEKGRRIFAPMPETRRKPFKIIFSIILALCFFTCIMISPIMGVLEALLCMWVWTYCYYMSKKRFGGITEDVSGYFLTLCELVAVLFVGIFGNVLC